VSVVVARMFVQQITVNAHSPGAKTVVLQVVSRGTENKVWAAATPSGSATLTINNGTAAEQFEIGKEYLVQFELDEAAPAASNAYGG
jgi:hypothetical protein